MKQDAAITELVGALLVVALIAGAVGIISVVLISQPHPLDKVAGDFELKIDPISEGAKVYISHVRGDPFQVTKEGEDPSFRILVNGNEWPVSLSDSGEKNNFTLIKGQTNSDYGEYYSSGDTLEAVSDEKPETIAFIEIKPDGSEYLLWSYGGNGKEANNVDFYGEPRVACIGEDVSFYDASTNNPDSWEWDFGDGEKSDKQNPIHKYSNIGKYTVTLTAGTPSLTETKTNYISVQPIVPEFSGTPLFGFETLDVQFRNLSRCGIGDSYSWQFIDSINGDTTTSNIPEPLIPFDAVVPSGETDKKVTKYDVVFTVKQGSNLYPVTKNQYITVCPKLEVIFTATPENGRAPLPVQFNDFSKGDVNRWQWNFGDGSANKTEKNPIHTFADPGQYTITLTIYNACGSKTESKSMWITVDSDCDRVVADFELEDPSKTVYAGVNTKFIDKSYTIPSDSSDIITQWDWNFGDDSLNVTGNSPVEQNPSHSFSTSGVFPVMLTVENACNSKNTASKNIIVEDCPDFKVDFGYKPTFIIGDEENSLKVVFEANAVAPTLNDEIESWTWDFGDINNLTPGYGQNPTHVYENVGESSTFNVILTATNYCGKTVEQPGTVYDKCPDIEQDFSFTATPNTNGKGVIVKFFENSGPDENITSCQWFFGDGTNWTSPDPQNDRTPEDHVYSDWRTYYITEQLQNRCGPIFPPKTLPLVVTSPVIITGHIYDDLNLNGMQDSGEWDLIDWPVVLQEQVNGVWNDRPLKTTDDNGWYKYELNDVTHGIFRVVEDLPAIWNVTSSYGVSRSGPDKNPISGQFVVYSKRNYLINFSNVDWHVSSMQLPFGYYLSNGGTFHFDDGQGEYWGFTRSYDPVEYQIPGNQYFRYKRANVYQVPPYGRLGNSSFSITLSPDPASFISYDYDWRGRLYIKRSEWVDKWTYYGPPYIETKGTTFYVPDNNTVNYPPGFTGDRLRIDTAVNNTLYSIIDPPYEGQEIPYDEHFGAYKNNQYIFSCLVTGEASKLRVYLKTPEEKELTWRPAPFGYFVLDWDNRKYEGQKITFSTEAVASEGTVKAKRNVFVGFEPLIPSFIDVLTNYPTQGNTTVNAMVKGHNYDKNNVTVIVGNKTIGQESYKMTWTNGNDVLNYSTVTFNSEKWTGRIIPMFIRATPRYENGRFRGYPVDSDIKFIYIPNNYAIKANFTADPSTGIAPLEVVFKDTSIGAPVHWDWNFGDGTSNITGNTVNEQHPFHLYTTTGTFPVTLTVMNIKEDKSSYTQNITVPSFSGHVNLLSSRIGTLNSGSYIKWIVDDDGSSITMDDTKFSLSNGDIVKLSLLSSLDEADISVANSITACNLSNIQLSINEVNVIEGDCTAIDIGSYLGFQSTLKISAAKNSTAWLNLIWNGNAVSVPTVRNLDISNIMPDINRFLIVKIQSGEIYIDGNASAYQIYR